MMDEMKSRTEASIGTVDNRREREEVCEIRVSHVSISSFDGV
jgi:hypothetical protein